MSSIPSASWDAACDSPRFFHTFQPANSPRAKSFGSRATRGANWWQSPLFEVAHVSMWCTARRGARRDVAHVSRRAVPTFVSAFPSVFAVRTPKLPSLRSLWSTHHRRSKKSTAPPSLMPQRHHRVDFGCPPGRNVAGRQCHKNKGERNNAERERVRCLYPIQLA